MDRELQTNILQALDAVNQTLTAIGRLLDESESKAVSYTTGLLDSAGAAMNVLTKNITLYNGRLVAEREDELEYDA